MFHDLNVPWTANDRELQRTIAFLDELGYDVVALTHMISGKLPSELTNPIPTTLSFPTPPRMRILRRLNLTLTDHTQNHRLATLSSLYDILALRPTDEKTLKQACETLDCDIISLDLSVRFPTHFKYKTLASAITRGIKIELCYAQGISASDASAKRNVIGNVVQLIRVTRGRGLIISSEARNALGLRAPSDVINLASVWGLGTERGKEAICKEARSCVVQAGLKRTSYRGVVDVVFGGEKPEENKAQQRADKEKGKKRKAENMENGDAQPKAISKREKKRQEKKTRLEVQNNGGQETPKDNTSTTSVAVEMKG